MEVIESFFTKAGDVYLDLNIQKDRNGFIVFVLSDSIGTKYVYPGGNDRPINKLILSSLGALFLRAAEKL